VTSWRSSQQWAWLGAAAGVIATSASDVRRITRWRESVSLTVVFMLQQAAHCWHSSGLISRSWMSTTTAQT